MMMTGGCQFGKGVPGRVLGCDGVPAAWRAASGALGRCPGPRAASRAGGLAPRRPATSRSGAERRAAVARAGESAAPWTGRPSPTDGAFEPGRANAGPPGCNEGSGRARCPAAWWAGKGRDGPGAPGRGEPRQRAQRAKPAAARETNRRRQQDAAAPRAWRRAVLIRSNDKQLPAGPRLRKYRNGGGGSASEDGRASTIAPGRGRTGRVAASRGVVRSVRRGVGGAGRPRVGRAVRPARR